MTRPGRHTRWRAAAFAAGSAAALASVAVGPRYLRATALVVNASGIDGWPQQAAEWHAVAVRTEERRIPTRHGPVRARLYAPDARPRRVLVMAPGIHPDGIDDPRLHTLAGHLASRRFAVLTIELPDLVRFRITPRTTDLIEDAAEWAAGHGALAPEGGVGLVGISFAGGLSVSAAGRPGLRDRVRFVLSLGGHGDLRRTLRYLCTGVLADGTRWPPHDYGVAITLLTVADRVVPPAQVEPLRTGILTFLEASRLDALDKTLAAAAFARARALEAEMPAPAAALMRAVNARDVATLGSTLLPHIASMADDPALSPELAPPPSAPVYLLHGAADNVIPAMESRLLAEHLEKRTRVELLVTPIIRHADVDRRPGIRDTARLVSFWAGALDE